MQLNQLTETLGFRPIPTGQAKEHLRLDFAPTDDDLIYYKEDPDTANKCVAFYRNETFQAVVIDESGERQAYEGKNATEAVKVFN